MRLIIFSIAAAVVAACSGKSSTPTSSSPPASSGGGSGSGGGTTVSIQQAAPALGRQLGQFTMTALREVSAQSAASTPPGLGPLAIFSGSYRASCPDGGSREMINLPTNLPFIGQVDLSSVTQVYTSCGYTESGTRYTANGRVSMRGNYWKAERQDQDVRLQGPISLSPVVGDQQIDGRIGQDGSYNGTITGVNVITGPTAPPPPAPPTTAQLLNGDWAGRQIARCTTTAAGISITCDWTWDLFIQVTGGGNNLNFATRATLIRASGNEAACSAGVGAVTNSAGPVTAQNGQLNFGGGSTGEYNSAGTWMGGRYRETVNAGGGTTTCNGDWQAARGR